MAQSFCPGCRQKTDRDAGFCSLCGFDFASDRDEAYNRKVMFWLRAAALLSGTVCLLSIRSMGRRPELGDYGYMLLLGAVPAGVIWGGLKLVFPDTRRKLWATALIPGMIMVAMVFAWRAAEASDSSLSWRRLLGAEVDQPTARIASTLPATEPADEFATLYPLASECFVLLRKQPDVIASDLTNGGLQKMIAPSALEGRRQLDASRARIKKLAERLDDYESRIRQSAADLTKTVKASDAPKRVQKRFLSAVRRSGGEFARGVLDFVALQRRLLSTTDDLLALLQSRADKFLVVRNRLAFADVADEKQYDELRRRLDDLTVETERTAIYLHHRGEQAIRDLDWGGSEAQPPPRPAAANAANAAAAAAR
jgi:hypothetical protein